MADQHQSAEASITPQEMAGLAERTRKVMAEFLQRHATEQAENPDPLNIANAFTQMTAHLVQNPEKLWEMQAAFWQDYMQLWSGSVRKFWGLDSKPVIEPSPGDRRFKDREWSENAAFDFIKQSYLLAARHIEETANSTDGLDEGTRKKIDFYTKQFIDAMAPSNFAMTNPEVVRATIETKGDNLVRGLKNLLDDIERGKGRLDIRMTDYEAFEVGKNIAVTPGKVVYQNDLIQLIQYTPTTPNVAQRPLLIVPPWINKFYILDLTAPKSFIRYMVGKGF
ncbi:MAG: class I poly(R)-hydroxyalkanoic acid synthase, partial [Alphaproteobacteria bacterium]